MPTGLVRWIEECSYLFIFTFSNSLHLWRNLPFHLPCQVMKYTEYNFPKYQCTFGSGLCSMSWYILPLRMPYGEMSSHSRCGDKKTKICLLWKTEITINDKFCKLVKMTKTANSSVLFVLGQMACFDLNFMCVV